MFAVWAAILAIGTFCVCGLLHIAGEVDAMKRRFDDADRREWVKKRQEGGQ